MILMQEKIIDTIGIKLLHQFFPEELIEYFNIKSFETLCSLETKSEYWIKVFEEKNIIPCEYLLVDYKSKGFMESKLIQDFPLRGKAVFLKIVKRRWQHKQTGEIIKRDFSFMSVGSKFTQEL